MVIEYHLKCNMNRPLALVVSAKLGTKKCALATLPQRFGDIGPKSLTGNSPVYP